MVSFLEFLSGRRLAKEVDCYTIIATHFHELTTLAEEVRSVVNFHVTAVASESGLTMMYKVERGPCDRSFGLHVAQVTGFPADVIEVFLTNFKHRKIIVLQQLSISIADSEEYGKDT